MGVDKKNFWYLMATTVLDRTKYRGRGRPRKVDYRKFPGPQDFAPLVWEIEMPKDGYIISVGTAE